MSSSTTMSEPTDLSIEEDSYEMSNKLQLYETLVHSYKKEIDMLHELEQPNDDIRHSVISSLNDSLQFEFYRCLSKDDTTHVQLLYDDFKQKYTEISMEDCVCCIYIKLFDVYMNIKKYSYKHIYQILNTIFIGLNTINFKVNSIYIAIIYTYIANIYSNINHFDQAKKFYRKSISIFNSSELTEYKITRPTFYECSYNPIYTLTKLGLYKVWYYKQTSTEIPIESGYIKYLSEDNHIIVRLVCLNNLIWLSFMKLDHDNLIEYFTQLCDISSSYIPEIYTEQQIVHFIVKESLFIISSYMKDDDYDPQITLIERILMYIKVDPDHDVCYPSHLVKATLLQDLSTSFDISRFITSLLYTNILYRLNNSDFDDHMSILIKFIDDCNFINPLDNYFPSHLIYIFDFDIYIFLREYHAKQLISVKIQNTFKLIKNVNKQITATTAYIAAIVANNAATEVNCIVNKVLCEVKILSQKHKKDKKKLKKSTKKLKKATEKIQLVTMNAASNAIHAAFDANIAVQKAFDMITKLKQDQHTYIVNSILFEVILPSVMKSIDNSQLCISCFNPGTVLYCSHKILCEQCNSNHLISNERCIICKH